jgi:hypothetical protein
MGGPFDFRNNVLFNWEHRTIDGGDGSSEINLVANYFKPGPVTKGELRHRICRIDARSSRYEFPGFGKWYVAGNFVEGRPDITADNWAGGVYFGAAERDKGEIIPMGKEEDARASQPFPSLPITEHKAEEAYRLVIAQAGASLPRRDAVDDRVIESVRTGRTLTQDGIIDDPAEVGGWPEYRSAPAPSDEDADGLPDAWETRHGLDPSDISDSSKDGDGDGYTAIEEYLNGTDPSRSVDYTRPENNRNVLHKPDGTR